MTLVKRSKAGVYYACEPDGTISRRLTKTELDALEGGRTMSDDRHPMLREWDKLLVTALKDLGEAVAALTTDDLVPRPPLPTPRTFLIAGESVDNDNAAVWPVQAHDEGGKVLVHWDMMRLPAIHMLRSGTVASVLFTGHETPRIARTIIEVANQRPRQVVIALRRIEAATAWCRARRQGRERMAERLLQFQQRWVNILDAEAAYAVLGGEGR